MADLEYLVSLQPEESEEKEYQRKIGNFSSDLEKIVKKIDGAGKCLDYGAMWEEDNVRMKQIVQWMKGDYEDDGEYFFIFLKMLLGKRRARFRLILVLR